VVSIEAVIIAEIPGTRLLALRMRGGETPLETSCDDQLWGIVGLLAQELNDGGWRGIGFVASCQPANGAGRRGVGL
jgi:hypothetical protein